MHIEELDLEGCHIRPDPLDNRDLRLGELLE